MEVVELKLDLAENRKKSYKAVMTSDGNEIVAFSNLKAVETETEITIRLHVPATYLPVGSYAVSLFGSGEAEPVETFYFQILRNQP